MTERYPSELPLPTPAEASGRLKSINKLTIDEFALYMQFRRIAGRIEERQVHENYLANGKGKHIRIAYRSIGVPANELTGPQPLSVGLRESRQHLLDRTIVRPQLVVSSATRSIPTGPILKPMLRLPIIVNEVDQPIWLNDLGGLLTSDIPAMQKDQAVYTRWLDVAMAAQILGPTAN